MVDKVRWRNWSKTWIWAHPSSTFSEPQQLRDDPIASPYGIYKVWAYLEPFLFVNGVSSFKLGWWPLSFSRLMPADPGRLSFRVFWFLFFIWVRAYHVSYSFLSLLISFPTVITKNQNILWISNVKVWHSIPLCAQWWTRYSPRKKLS